MGIFDVLVFFSIDLRKRARRQKEEFKKVLFGEVKTIRDNAAKNFLGGDTSSIFCVKIIPTICPYLDGRKKCKASIEELDSFLMAYGEMKVKKSRDLEYEYLRLKGENINGCGISGNETIIFNKSDSIDAAFNLGCTKSSLAATMLLEAKKRIFDKDILTAIDWGIRTIGRTASENGLISVLTQGIKDRIGEGL